MKSMLIVLAAAGSLVVAGAARADAKLAQDKGCMGCHATDQKKVGPSFKDVSAKIKNDKDADAKITTALKEGKGHPKVNASDDELKKLVAWIRSL